MKQLVLIRHGQSLWNAENRFTGWVDSPLSKRGIQEAMKAGKKVDKLPLTLGEAIDRLDNDEIIKSALPDEMLRVFMHYKKDEWEKFLSAVTQWDVDTYLDILP